MKSSFNVSTKYESYRDNQNNYQQRFIGYSCSHGLNLEFDLDMEKLGATIGAIAKCEANPKFNIKFSIKDPNAVSEQLLESAVENAKWKATVLAKAAGVKLGEIQRIDYSWRDINLYSETDMIVVESALRVAEAAPEAMDIVPEDIDVSDTATVVWLIE